MSDTLNIYQRMAAITAELQTVGKNLVVETAKGKGYKAVSERDILDAVKPVEAKFGVYSYPCSRRVLESQTLESESSYNGSTSKRTTFFTRIETVYRFVNMDEPDDFIETTTFSEGIDSQDKGSGKAMTYADKYALMKAYKISTGDDPDQNASEDTKYTPKKAEYISEVMAERIISGMVYLVGDKVADHRSLLHEICGLTDPYKIPASEGQKVLDNLLERAKKK